MITDIQFEKLSEYKTSSWAIWSKEFLNADCHKCRENEEEQPKKYFSENLRLLKNNIILLGLNPSGKKKNKSSTPSRLLGNFHTVKNGKRHKGDLLLSKNIMEFKNIQGAYMTDISDVVEGKSLKVSLDDNIVKDQLEEKLKILGSKNIHIICFGNRVFDTINNILGNGIKRIENEYGVKEFTKNWKNKDLKFYRVYHYSYIARWNKDDDKVKFKKQLEYVDKAVQKNP